MKDITKGSAEAESAADSSIPHTLLRQWAMLQRIPRRGRVGSMDLVRYLAAQGFHVTQRTVQRDLLALQAVFPGLQCDGHRPLGWHWGQDTEAMDIPGIDPPLALSFKLIEGFLGPLLPPTVGDHLKPYFDSAARVLRELDRPDFARWADRVRVLPRTQPLKPARLDPNVVEGVYEALFQGKRFLGRYRRRNGDEAEYLFNPLGLVFREPVIYLVATLRDYTDLRHFALHRLLSCTLEDTPATMPPGFDLDAYLHGGSFEYPVSFEQPMESATLSLVIRFTAQVAAHLRETPLSDDQILTDEPEGMVRISATVHNTQQLRWWLLGFGDQVEVLEPEGLRAEFAAKARGMARRYCQNEVD